MRRRRRKAGDDLDDGARPQTRATIHDIAREAGVSTATVSRFFNQPEKVSAATRDRVPIVAVTTDDRSARQMRLFRGVIPLALAPPPDAADLPGVMDAWLAEHDLAAAGDAWVLVSGAPLGRPHVTNALSIHVVGEGPA